MLNPQTNPFKSKHTLYKQNNNEIEYISIIKRFKFEVVLVKGILEKEYEIKIYDFSSQDLANAFQEEKYKALAPIYKYNPRYIPLKIEFNFSNYNEEQIIDAFFPFTDFLESHLNLSGNGYIPDNFFDEMNNKEISAIENKNNLYSISFFVINPKVTISEIRTYMNLNGKIDYTIF